MIVVWLLSFWFVYAKNKLIKLLSKLEEKPDSPSLSELTETAVNFLQNKEIIQIMDHISQMDWLSVGQVNSNEITIYRSNI